MSNHWAELDEKICPCLGKGWAETSPETWKECPIHYAGQLHPETYALLLDEPNRLAIEERKAFLHYQIKTSRSLISGLENQLHLEKAKLTKLELELVNKTPTVRAMAAVSLPREPEEVIEIQDGDFI